MAYLQVCFNDNVLEEHELTKPAISIGRNPECDVTINNTGISALHALITQKHGRFVLEDAASTNGVVVNGERLANAELRIGDEIELLGKFTLRLVEEPMGLAPRSTHARHDPSQTQTMHLDVGALGSMPSRPAYLTLARKHDRPWVQPLHKAQTVFGRRRSADVRLSGWRAPSVAAVIEIRTDGYYLCSDHPNVNVAGLPVVGQRRLQQDDHFSVLGISGVFHDRAGADG